ncbi:hypothetical protein P43SY_005220 [Pythium insidiosum]|uniref:Hexose transporter 1 n=1 Tax=Pythium insidiosum TaxID=114742 RepID=A0AAD5Q9L9_PYTIN|nr:hypothetical protein P43SY_005220 [Pythium insidiosum]
MSSRSRTSDEDGSRLSASFSSLQTPRANANATALARVASAKDLPAYVGIKVNLILYSSIFLMLLQTMQYSWSISQMNYSRFNNKDDCDARPIAPGHCLMFPKHTAPQWMLLVNIWLVGGVIAGLTSGKIADRIGRKKTHMLSAALSIVGGILMTAAVNIPMFAVGRFIAGLASGVTGTLTSGYITEVSPPHMRNKLGISYQASRGVGGTVAVLFFFFANTSTGWRYIAAVPVICSIIALAATPRFMVESPTWLLTQGRQEEAEIEIARLFGEENVDLALSWMDTIVRTSIVELEAQALAESKGSSAWRELFSPAYRQQTILAIMLSLAQQFSGINAAFLYSSSIFKTAGVEDDRIGTLIVNGVHLIPTMLSGMVGTRFGNRRMILFGHGAMMISAIGLTIAMATKVSALSILFMASYVAAYGISMGPLVFVIGSSIFPDTLRANGTAACLGANWLGLLTIGICFPFIAHALGNYAFVPFVVLIIGFATYMYYCLPETSGLTSEQIQEAFRAKQNAQDTASEEEEEV